MNQITKKLRTNLGVSRLCGTGSRIKIGTSGPDGSEVKGYRGQRTG